MVYVDPLNSSLYKAKAANGTIYWPSKDASTTLQNALDAAPTDGVINLKSQIALTTGLNFGDKSITLMSNWFGTVDNPNIIFTGSTNILNITFTASAHPTVNGQKRVTLQNLYIDGQDYGLDAIHVTGVWGTGLTLDNIAINRAGDRGYYSNVNGLYVSGSTVKITSCGAQGYYVAGSEQVALQDLWCSNNADDIAHPKYQIYVTAWCGSIGRIVVAGDLVAHASGIGLVDGGIGLHVGIIHLEDIDRYGFVMGISDLSSSDWVNSDFGTIWAYNVASESTGWDYVPFQINSASGVTIGNLVDTGAAPYTPAHSASLVAFNCTKCTIITADLPQGVYRSTFAHDNGLVVVNNGTGAMDYP
jgi:hypothetical protein